LISTLITTVEPSRRTS